MSPHSNTAKNVFSKSSDNSLSDWYAATDHLLQPFLILHMFPAVVHCYNDSTITTWTSYISVQPHKKLPPCSTNVALIIWLKSWMSWRVRHSIMWNRQTVSLTQWTTLSRYSVIIFQKIMLNSHAAGCERCCSNPDSRQQSMRTQTALSEGFLFCSWSNICSAWGIGSFAQDV